MVEGEKFNKVRELLRKIFQFEDSDLDFGIYRIMNLKKKEIEKFIDKDLKEEIDKEFSNLMSSKEANLGDERDLLLIDIPYRTNDIRKGKGKFIWKAKTRKSQRVSIVFDEQVSTYIEAYFESNPTGVQCSTDYIYKVVASDKRYSFKSRILNCTEKTLEGNDLISESEKERLSNLIPHSLRSTYAYVCKELGLDNEHIAELLGHDDVKTLKDSYFQNTRQSLVLSITQSLR